MGFKSKRLARLRLEASNMNEGLDGVGKLARSWGAKQPVGFLYWLECLSGEMQGQDLAVAARKALAELPVGSERRRAARYLVEAGSMLDDDNIAYEGRKEAFRSSLSEHDLLLLMDEAIRRQSREKDITWSLKVLAEGEGKYNCKRLAVLLHLMAGDIQEAADLCRDEKVYGWSRGNPGALFFCAALCCMAGKHGEKCPVLNSMLAGYADAGYYFDAYDEGGEEPATAFDKEIKKGLAGIDITQESFAKLISMAMQNGAERIEYIVSNKYQKAYGRAAAVLGAMAEVLAVQGKIPEAGILVHKYYFEKYNRFSAFRKEVRNALATSPLLAEISRSLK